MFRKGQNYRIFIDERVVAEETSCTVTRGVDTEEASNKDLASDSTSGTIGGAKPIATYKNMQFQVEAQGQGAIYLFAAALRMMGPNGGTIGWTPTSGTYNRTVQGTLNAVKAICNDLTITAPNRQPVTCTAQFIAIPGNVDSHTDDNPYVPSSTVLRGEFLRLSLGNSLVAKATNVSLHVSLSMEDATTKDDVSASLEQLDYKAQVPTQINYDITSDCLYNGGLDNLTEGSTYQWDLPGIASGTAMLTNLVANAPVNQNVTYSATFTGIGTLGNANRANNGGNRNRASDDESGANNGDDVSEANNVGDESGANNGDDVSGANNVGDNISSAQTSPGGDQIVDTPKTL